MKQTLKACTLFFTVTFMVLAHHADPNKNNYSSGPTHVESESDKGSSSYGSIWGGSFGSSFGSSYDDDDDYSYGGGSGTGGVTCSPQKLETNLEKTDKFAKEILANEQMSSQGNLKETLSEILKIKNEVKRLTSYFALVEVKNPTELVYFIGARKDELQKYEASFIVNTQVSPELAAKLVEKLTKTLKAR